MSEFMKDSAIKLFGQNISLLPDDKTAADHLLEQRQGSPETSTSLDSKDESGGDLTWNKEKDGSTSPTEETLTELATSYGSKKTGCLEKVPLSPKTSKEEEERSEVGASDQEKTLITKPGKILPCPRCNSKDTKFCYYNNYNANQPRHFCKNCQRYWTAGGTMRNVPVGSGRRKNKNLYSHTMVTDAFQATRANSINGIHLPNGFILLGSDRPLDELVASLAERSQNYVRNELYEPSIISSGGTSNSPGPRLACDSSGFPITFSPTRPNRGAAVSPTSSEPAALWISPSSTALGKHSREGTLLRPSNSGNDDLSEINRTSFFKALQSKGHKNGHIDINAMVLQANPVALSRSLNFHESV